MVASSAWSTAGASTTWSAATSPTGGREAAEVAGRLRALASRLARPGGARVLQLEARTASTRLGWDAPATTVTLAGVHGGSGTSTLCLLLAQAGGNLRGGAG